VAVSARQPHSFINVSPTSYNFIVVSYYNYHISTSFCLLECGPCQLHSSLCHTHWMCCYSVMIPSVHMTSIVHLVTWLLLFIWSHDIYCSSNHMTSIVLSIVERDPPLLLSWRVLHFLPLKGFLLFLRSCSWSDVRSKVRDVVCV